MALVDHHREGLQVSGLDLPAAHQRRDEGQVGAAQVGIVNTDSQHVSPGVKSGQGNRDLGVILVGGIPHRPIGLGVVVNIPAGHVDPPHLLGIEVDHEAIIKTHVENHRAELLRVLHLENLPAENCQVAVAHIIELGAIISVTIANAGGAALPARIIEVKLPPAGGRIAVTAKIAPGRVVGNHHRVDKAHLGVEVGPARGAAHLRAQLPAVRIITVGIGSLDGQGVSCTLRPARPLPAVIVADLADRRALGIGQLDGLAGIVECPDEIAMRIRNAVPGLDSLLVATDHQVRGRGNKAPLRKNIADPARKTVTGEVIGLGAIVEDLDKFELRTRDSLAVGWIKMDLCNNDLSPGRGHGETEENEIPGSQDSAPPGRLQLCAFQFHRSLYFLTNR